MSAALYDKKRWSKREVKQAVGREGRQNRMLKNQKRRRDVEDLEEDFDDVEVEGSLSPSHEPMAAQAQGRRVR